MFDPTNHPRWCATALAATLLPSTACSTRQPDEPVARAPTPPTARTEPRAPDSAPPPAAPIQSPIPEDRRVDAPPATYYDEKIKAMFLDHMAANGNFKMSVIPLPPIFQIAGQYRSWAEKRRDPAEMMVLADEVRAHNTDLLMASLTLIYVGDMFSSGRTSIDVPQDIADYVFLENDRGQAVRSSRAVLPLMRSAGAMTKQVVVHFEFAGIERSHPDFFDTESIRFVVGGLDLADHTITYRYPLDDVFADAPEAILKLHRPVGG